MHVCVHGSNRPPFVRETIHYSFKTEADARAKHDDPKTKFGDHCVAVLSRLYAKSWRRLDSAAARRRVAVSMH